MSYAITCLTHTRLDPLRKGPKVSSKRSSVVIGQRSVRPGETITVSDAFYATVKPIVDRYISFGLVAIRQTNTPASLGTLPATAPQKEETALPPIISTSIDVALAQTKPAEAEVEDEEPRIVEEVLATPAPSPAENVGVVIETPPGAPETEAPAAPQTAEPAPAPKSKGKSKGFTTSKTA